MIEKSMDEILEKLAWIGFNKELLPWGLRGWVAELGLHVQSFEGGNRIQAGGRLRSYCEARNSDGNPDSPQVVVFLATIVDVTVGS